MQTGRLDDADYRCTECDGHHPDEWCRGIPKQASGRPEQHDWSGWFTAIQEDDRIVVRLQRHVHYKCTSRSMADQARQAAKRYDIDVQVHVRGDHVYIQAASDEN